MTGRKIILAAAACYLAVIACVIGAARSTDTTAGASVTHGAASGDARGMVMPLRGIAIQVQRVDWMDKYEVAIDEVAAMGADTVELIIDTRQENGASAKIWLDQRITATIPQLQRLIKRAKQRDLRVVLMPIVLLDKPRGTEWRGKISPSSDNGGWTAWWKSYREVITHFAGIAEETGVDVLVVGSELVSSERMVDQWRQTIAEVREIYGGLLTYSSNWDHYHTVGFWDDLDLIGMNSYWKLGNDHTATVEEMVGRWQEIQSDLLAFQRKVSKPIYFTEVGWCSLQNAAHASWDYTRTSLPVDLDLQTRLYEAFFQSWHGNNALGGFAFWEWPAEGGGPQDKGYTPKGKPAEQLLREWLNKPWK
jgi:hypothetical protein